MKLTPKQKAEELVNKYIPHIAGADRYNSTLGLYDKEISKQCALIAVEEIISLDIFDCNDDWSTDDGDTREYWQEVRNELLKKKT